MSNLKETRGHEINYGLFINITITNDQSNEQIRHLYRYLGSKKEKK